MSASSTFPLTGVAHVAQLETEYMLSHGVGICNNCLAVGFDKPLRRCNGCRLAAYCSKECQKQNWSQHKRFCNFAQGKGKKNAFLTGLDPDECFRILIDSYRLRTDNDHLHRDEDHGIYYSGKLGDGLVWAHGDVYADFQNYLDLAEAAGVLPLHWNFEERMQCMAAAVDKYKMGNVFDKVDQERLLTDYEGDTTIRNVLCILAELVVGYEGKGGPKNDTWFHEFQEFLDLHPEEKARLISGSVEAVKAALESQDASGDTSD